MTHTELNCGWLRRAHRGMKKQDGVALRRVCKNWGRVGRITQGIISKGAACMGAAALSRSKSASWPDWWAGMNGARSLM